MLEYSLTIKGKPVDIMVAPDGNFGIEIRDPSNPNITYSVSASPEDERGNFQLKVGMTTWKDQNYTSVVFSTTVRKNSGPDPLTLLLLALAFGPEADIPSWLMAAAH